MALRAPGMLGLGRASATARAQPRTPAVKQLGRSCRLHIVAFKDRSASPPDGEQPPKPIVTGLQLPQTQQPAIPQGPAPSVPASSASPATTSFDADEYPEGFKSRRLLCFLGFTIGYMGLYLTRSSLTYTAPVMVADPSLGIKLTDIGAMTSAFPLAYGVSKFLGGVLGAKFSARSMIAYGLLVTAAINVAFGFSASSVALLTGLWFMNGLLQGIGAPASATLLTRWFPSKERGTWWGLWNSGANVGGFLTPVIVGFVAKHYGWQWGMWTPGILGAAVAMFALAAIRDSPEQAGYPPPERLAAAQAASPSSNGKPAQSGASIREAFAQVVRNPGIWLLALTYFCVYVVRQGATSWLVFYLMANKGVPDAAQAAVTVSGMELGGLVGGTLAGALSDIHIRNAEKANGAGQDGKKEAGYVGRRVQIIMMYVAAIWVVLLAVKLVPPGATFLQWLSIAALGFCIYGPHMLIGLCGAELVDKPAVSASQGLLGLVAYLGAANAGAPLSWVVQNYGWGGYFTAMAAACAVAIGLLLPLANAPSRIQDLQHARANGNTGTGGMQLGRA